MGRISKVSFQEKISAVKDLLNGIRTVGQISRILEVNESTVRQWLLLYETKGAEGLQYSPYNLDYPHEIKLNAVRDYLEGKASQREICKTYQISSHGVLQTWIKGSNGHEVVVKSRYSKGDGRMTS